MFNFIKKYVKSTPSNRILINTRLSILLNLCIIVGKLIISIFYGYFFLISALTNVFFSLAKFVSVRSNHVTNIKINKTNAIVGSLVVSAGLVYAVYMARLLYSDVETMKYDMGLGVIIAFISFIELTVAIRNNIKTQNDNYILKHIKKINMCNAITAIVLTEIAIMSFADPRDTREIDAMFGLFAGLIIVLIGIYIIISKYISLCGNEMNSYHIEKGCIIEDSLEIELYKSKLFPSVIYVAKRNGNYIDGVIKKGKNPLLHMNIMLIILVAILSEILVFPYLIGLFIVHIKNRKLVNKLDNIMLEKGCKKIKNE